jgi:hypothetical protein
VLTVSVITRLADVAILKQESMTIPAGKTAETTVVWTPAEEFWGCAVTATLRAAAGDAVLARGERLLVVSENPLRTSANYGGLHNVGKGGAFVDQALQGYVDYGVPLFEMVGLLPGGWGNVVPEKEEWLAGNNYYWTRTGAREAVDKAHALGLTVMCYAHPVLAGLPGYEWAQSHPEDVLYDNPNHDLTVDPGELAALRQEAANPAQAQQHEPFFWNLVNSSRAETLDRGIDQYIEAFRFFGIDGVRWDGHPGIFYDPRRDWIYRCNGAKLLPGYDVEGNLVVAKDPDALNLSVYQRFHSRLKAGLPDLLEGYNLQLDDGYADTSDDLVWPRTYAALGHNSMVLDEKHMQYNQDGVPYMHKTWSDMVRRLRLADDSARRVGAFHYVGGIGYGGSPAFFKYLLSRYYALGIRAYGVAPWVVPDRHPQEFSRFAQRYAEFLFHPSLMRFDPATPIDRLSVMSGAPFPVEYKPYCKDLAANGRFRILVHLVTPAHPEAINVPKAEAPPWTVKDATVLMRQPAGLDGSQARVYLLSPEWTPELVSAACDLTQPVLRIPVPEFRYWAMVVAEYPLSPTESGLPAVWALPVEQDPDHPVLQR